MKRFYLLTILCALLGVNQTWAQTYVLNEGTTSVTLVNGLSVSSPKEYTLSGPGATLTFELEKTSSVATGGFTVKAGDVTVKEIGIGELSRNQWKGYNVDLTAFDNYQTNRKLTFQASGTLAKYLRSAKVTMAEYINNPSRTSIEFGKGELNTSDASQTITIEWCNVPAMTYEITGDDNAQFGVEVSNNAAAGKFGTATFTVSYKHNVEGVHSAELVISDTYGDYSKIISLAGETEKKANTITWGVSEGWKDWNDQIELNATSNHNETEIQYAFSNTDYVDVNDNVVTFLEAGAGQEVTITVSQAGNDTYKAASPIVKTFNIKRQQVLVWDAEVVNPNMAVGAERDITGYAKPQYATEQTVTYSSADAEIISVDGSTLTANAVGEVEIIATIAADEQNRAAEARKTFTVKEKESVVVKQGDAIIEQNGVLTLHLGETTGVITSSNEANELQISISEESIARYNTETKRIEAVSVGQTTLTLTQEAINEYLPYSNTVTIKVELIENTLDVVADAIEKFVDEELTDFIVVGNSDAAITVESSDPTIAYYDAENEKVLIPNSEAKSFESTVVTLTVRQAANESIAAAEKTIALTVKKYENIIKVNGETDFSVTIMPGATLAIAITSDNEADKESIQSTQTAGANVVSYDEENGVLVTNYRTGNAKWDVTQAESYKYRAAEASFSVKVARESESTCYVLENQAAEEKSRFGGTMHEHTWTYENCAGVVSFDVHRESGIAVDQYVQIQEYVDNNWRDTENGKVDDFGTTTVRRSVTLNQAAQGVRFFCSGTQNDCVSNVSVTRKTYLNAENLVMEALPTEEGESVLAITYSLANGGDLKITCDNERITFGDDRKATATVCDVNCNNNTENVKIYYAARDEEGDDVANVIIYNGVYNKTIQLVAKTRKQTPEITWNIAELTYGDEKEDAASVNKSVELKYEVLEGDAVRAENGKLIAQNTGDAKVRAYTDATVKYNAAEETIIITVNKASTSVTVAPTATGIVYGQTLENSELKNGEGSVEGTFAWQDNSIAPNAGTQEYDVVFTPTDKVHYATSIVKVSVIVAKANAVVTVAPKAKDLKYNEEAQELIEAGEAEGGELQYSLDGENYSAELPTGTEAKTYIVYYKVFGDANHNDTDASYLDVTIASKPTGIDETEAGEKAVKVLRDGKLYIIRGEKVYTINGLEVR